VIVYNGKRSISRCRSRVVEGEINYVCQIKIKQIKMKEETDDDKGTGNLDYLIN